MSTIEQTEQRIPTGTWKADTVHSRVAFEVPYAVATFTGEVPDFEASLQDGTLTGVAHIASIKVKEENLEAHLLSPEFFDAERHPDVTFASKAIRRSGDDVEIDGEITIKGITKPAKLTGTASGPAIDHFGAHRFGLQLQTTVDRTEFDMNWNMPLPNGEPALANTVTLKAELTLVEQEA
jgi:polyisoprenoid-binding protein YceI